MTSRTGIGGRMESEFSDNDDIGNAGEHHALLAKSCPQSPVADHRFLPNMREEMEKQAVAVSDNGKGGGLGLAAIGRYPKGVFFCLGNEFSERFSYYGMRAVLTLYLISVHDMEASTAKLFFHAFVSLAYFTPVLGSILADGFLGRYRVILYISILYCFGHLLLTMGAAVTTGSIAMKILDFTGLFIIALSTGGIKPCVSAFAADQFPETMYQERKQFFSFFYFSINVGALLSKIITPLLRRHHCMGHDTCFPLAFGIPAIFMFLATIMFWGGTRFYKIVPRKDNVIVRVCQCVVYALRQRAGRSKTENPHKHWLDYARPKYDQTLIDDVKTIIRVLILYIPVVFFWSLFDQLGSTWVLQANAMNGRVGRLTVLPDQMPVFNPFLIIVLVPVLEGVVYPLLSKCNVLVKPLRRMGWGGLLAAASFALGGLVQLKVDQTSVILPKEGFGRFVVISYASTPVNIFSDNTNVTMDAHDSSQYTVDVNANVTVRSAGLSTFIPVKSAQGTFAVFFDQLQMYSTFQFDLKKTGGGKTRLYGILEENKDDTLQNIRRSLVVSQNGKNKGELVSNVSSAWHVDLEPELWGSNVYEIYLKSCRLAVSPFENGTCKETRLEWYTAEMGAVDVVMVRSDGSVSVLQLIQANTVSVLWQVPQYLIITVGEALFSITGLEFSYSEASPNMKSVLTAIWLLTTAFGNVVDMIISGSGMIKNNPALEFFVYSAMMTAVMLVFIVLAWRYKSSAHAGHGTIARDEMNLEPSSVKPPKVLKEME